MIYKQFIALILSIIAVLALSSCSHCPCKKYLGNWPKVKPERLLIVPQPIPPYKIRAYDLCLLKGKDVQIIRLGQTWKFILPNDALFENDTAEINDQYKPILNVIADFMRTYPKISVEVAAYSNHAVDDAVTKFGTITNQLTERQAAAVAKHLVRQHINSRFIYAVGRGNKNQIAWDGTEAGRRLNRRVEISFRYYRDSKAWY